MDTHSSPTNELEPREELRAATTATTAADAVRLERAHEAVRFALSEIASEGTLDHETIDDCARALVAALRDIEAVQVARLLTTVTELKGQAR